MISNTSRRGSSCISNYVYISSCTNSAQVFVWAQLKWQSPELLSWLAVMTSDTLRKSLFISLLCKEFLDTRGRINAQARWSMIIPQYVYNVQCTYYAMWMHLSRWNILPTCTHRAGYYMLSHTITAAVLNTPALWSHICCVSYLERATVKTGCKQIIMELWRKLTEKEIHISTCTHLYTYMYIYMYYVTLCMYIIVTWP